MGNVTVKYLLKGKELSSEEVEQNRNMFDPRCFQRLGRLSAVLKLKQTPHDTILWIDEHFNLSTESVFPEKE